jgi:hypothetical protein
VRDPEKGTLTYRCVFDFYRVEFERNLTNGQRIEPGMSVTVRVLTGKEGLLRYLSDRVMEKASLD